MGFNSAFKGLKE